MSTYNAEYEAQFDRFLKAGGKGKFNPPIRPVALYTCLPDTIDPRGPKGKWSMTDIVWAVSGLGFTMFVMGCWLGQELWRINKTLERIADSLEAKAEGEPNDD